MVDFASHLYGLVDLVRRRIIGLKGLVKGHPEPGAAEAFGP
jgi:hypothetical protein